MVAAAAGVAVAVKREELRAAVEAVVEVRAAEELTGWEVRVGAAVTAKAAAAATGEGS